MTDMLLVNPLFLRDDPVELELMTPYFPLGLLYIASIAREAGHDVSIFDAMFAESDDDFVAVLERERPRVVGFGVLATVRGAALRMAALAKRQGATVVFGGADPTARPQLYLQHQLDRVYPIDLVVIGEAEQTILEVLPLLLKGEASPKALGEVLGIAYRGEDGEIITTPCRSLISDVDQIPLPARDLLDLEAYREAWREAHDYFSLSIIATRGCPFNCTWCQKSVFGRSFRPRSPELVAEEMRVIKERYQPDQIRIIDDVIGIDRDWVQAWHDAVLEKGAVVPFECLSRVDLMDAEIARLLKEAGCCRINFGAESGSQKVLDAMHKGTSVEQTYETARICRELDIEIYFYMMVGYPGETWEDLKMSVALLRETRPDAFSTTIAYPLPGTDFYEQVRDRLSPDEAQMDWDHTAENRLLFKRGRSSTFFYRRIIRWFNHEWVDARMRAGDVQRSLRVRFRNTIALWRDRWLVYLLAWLAGDEAMAFHLAQEDQAR